MHESPWILAEHTIGDLAEHTRRGGGRALAAARHHDAASLCELIERSGLRGRGGAGFPTGRKWRTVATGTAPGTVPVVVNAAEGEPGTFKDRALLRRNPYLVLEGAAIAAQAVRARTVLIATKASFAEELLRLHRATAETVAAGWFDEREVRVVDGPSEYLFGEETALLEVLDGRPPFPRIAPPYRRGVAEDPGAAPGAAAGDGPAALVDNVETLANVVGIVRHGADWFRATGTQRSPGTVLCTVTGHTRHHGVGEFPMGTPLRSVLDSIGGGVRDGRRVGVVLCGVSGPPLTAEQLDTPLSYEAFAAIGCGLGSAGFIVVDDATPLVEVAAEVARFLATESCGQCEPCKRDGLALHARLAERAGVPTDRGDTPITQGADLDGLLATVSRGARCSLAAQTERVVGRLLALAGSTEEPGGTTVSDGRAPDDEGRFIIAPLVDIVDQVARLDVHHRDKRPDWSYPDDGPASGAWPAQHLENQPVHIRPPHTAERRTDAVTVAHPGRTALDPFAPLAELAERLESDLHELRTAAPAARAASVGALRSHLEQHRRITEAVVYPLAARLDPNADDLSFYPRRHEQRAVALAARLDSVADLGATEPVELDHLAVELHRTLAELELRVLPLLRDRLVDPDQAQRTRDALAALG